MKPQQSESERLFELATRMSIHVAQLEQATVRLRDDVIALLAKARRLQQEEASREAAPTE